MIPLILIGILLFGFVVWSYYQEIQENQEISEMRCNDLWDSMVEQYEEINGVSSKRIQHWIMNECWS